jgi:ABC-type Fe3+ transport system permease subunit
MYAFTILTHLSLRVSERAPFAVWILITCFFFFLVKYPADTTTREHIIMKLKTFKNKQLKQQSKKAFYVLWLWFAYCLASP